MVTTRGPDAEVERLEVEHDLMKLVIEMALKGPSVFEEMIAKFIVKWRSPSSCGPSDRQGENTEDRIPSDVPIEQPRSSEERSLMTLVVERLKSALNVDGDVRLSRSIDVFGKDSVELLEQESIENGRVNVAEEVVSEGPREVFPGTGGKDDTDNGAMGRRVHDLEDVRVEVSSDDDGQVQECGASHEDEGGFKQSQRANVAIDKYAGENPITFFHDQKILGSGPIELCEDVEERNVFIDPIRNVEYDDSSTYGGSMDIEADTEDDGQAINCDGKKDIEDANRIAQQIHN